MPDRSGGVFDIPQHGTHKTGDTQQAHLDPDLQIKVVGVDKGGLVVVQIEFPDVCLGGGGAEARSGEGERRMTSMAAL